jgi:methylmalonyl-CoA mutase cobalamin-binding subunit
MFYDTVPSVEIEEVLVFILKSVCRQMNNRLFDKTIKLLNTWAEMGRPGRATLHAAADELMAWRRAENVPGLWARPPRMLGATLDDGWGHGIKLILKLAKAIGCDTHFIGVLCPIDTIVEACDKETPDILGLTVLQLDTEEALANLRHRLSPQIRWIAGGPVFNIDPQMAARVGIDFVARDASHFLRYMLEDATKETAAPKG